MPRTRNVILSKLTIAKKTNTTVLNRLNKAKSSRNILKRRVFQDNEIRPKIKLDIYKAAIGSIVNYGLATLRTNVTMCKKLQQFAARRLREIIHTGNNDEPFDANGRRMRESNEIPREENKMTKVYWELQRGKQINIFSWGTAFAHAHLRNQQDMGGELRTLGRNWYSMQKYKRRNAIMMYFANARNSWRISNFLPHLTDGQR